MTLKYNKFKCYWAAVTEKTSNSVEREGPFLCARILNEKSAFFRPQLSLKSKIITNQVSNRLFSLPSKITQISERSL